MADRPYRPERPRSFLGTLPLADLHLRRRDRDPTCEKAPVRPCSQFEPTSSSGYFNAFPNSSTSQLPDAIEPVQDKPSPVEPCSPWPSSLLSHEEEGRETLPAYSCSLRAEGVFDRKMEMRSPFARADARSWKRVYVVLKGTMLSLHKPKGPGILRRRRHQQEQQRQQAAGAAQQAQMRAGRLIQRYTLQHAEVGIASDYQKRDFIPHALLNRLTRRGTTDERALFQQTRPFIIRLRAETDQFLLSCSSVHTFLYWLECLNAAIDLALPLDERVLPRHRTIPVRRRRRVTGEGERLSDDIAQQLALIEQAYEGQANEELAIAGPCRTDSEHSSQSVGWSIKSSLAKGVQRLLGEVRKTMPARSTSTSAAGAGKTRWRWWLAVGSSVPSGSDAVTRAVIRETASMASLRMRARRAESPPPPMPDLPPQPSVMRDIVDAYVVGPDAGAPSRPGPSSSTANDATMTATTTSTSLIRSEDKWRPPHNWSHARHVRYVRRCMSHLADDTPRRSDIIVKDGQKWKINWAREQLVRYDPDRLPAYRDTEEEQLQGQQAQTSTSRSAAAAEPRAILCF